MKQVLVQTVSSPGCIHCMEFEKFWETIKKDWPDVEMKKIMVTEPEGEELVGKYMIFASPAIIINGELFSTGGFSKEKFVEKLKELSGK